VSIWKPITAAGIFLFGLTPLWSQPPTANPAATKAPPPKAAPASAAQKKKDEKPQGPVLYIAQLRPVKDAEESTGYGTATLMLAADHRSAAVSVSHANLTSPITSAHLKLSIPKGESVYLVNFTRETQTSFDWAIESTGQFSPDALVDALARGRVYVSIDSRNHPTGELRGSFVRAVGSQQFTPPPAPPKFSLNEPSPEDVARFLTQATFGPSAEEIDEFLHPTPLPNRPPPRPHTFARWISDQMVRPASSHVELTRADFDNFPPDSPNPRVTQTNRQNAWWQIALTAPDQLRQRVAFALSQVFVVSDATGPLNGNPIAAAHYYDLLARHAFGNFRDLLEDVTLSPAMGAYLSHLKNAKGDPKRGTSPDENFAREVMQLFTIGLQELQPDGTYRLNKNGLPIPTYTQETIVQMAKVFTGYGFYSPEPKPNFFGARADYSSPMMLYPEFHDDSPKTIIGGKKLPAKQGGEADLKQTLDALFNHPNTAPFICRQLIQRLVTSNPSPGYVYRVAQVFAKNSQGKRGDLGAVIRAILLDYEARSPAVTQNFGYGKMKEPLLQTTALLRAFRATSANGRYHFPNPESTLGQAALRSPTVFNFFEPNYVVPGPLAAAGLFAPEYQIFTDTTAITIPNQLRTFIHSPAKPGPSALVLDLDPLTALVETPEKLVGQLNLVFCAGHLPEKARATILASLAALPPNTSALERVRHALDLVVTSPEAAIQR
jgi:uncharacterized protein (DUF1800 family)